MPLFPLFAELADREVLVVGGGEVAARKVEALLHAGALVQVHAHRVNRTLAQWLRDGRLRRLDGAFDPQWLDQVWLVVAATDDRAFNARLAVEAGQRRLLVNVVDDAGLSTFQIPSVVDRSPLLVAISSGGAAPMLARRLREQLEAQFDHSLGELATLFARHRAAIRATFPQLAQRRRWFEKVLDGNVPVLFQSGQREAAESAFQAMLQAGNDALAGGSVFLVGTGNGDPGLLTLKALRALNQADLILSAPEVNDGILGMARRDATHLPFPADGRALVAALVHHAVAGQRVACLKPGDSFRRPPDDDVPRALSERGVACEVIAGIAG